MTDQAEIDAFFELAYEPHEDVPDAIPRDQWGRPLIKQPDGTMKPYQRISSVASRIENRTGLHKWDVRHIVRGMGIREDVAAMAAALPSNTGDKKKDQPTNQLLDEYAEQAREAAREHNGANWGTAIHGFTEPGMNGNPAVPSRMQDDVASYWDMMERGRIECVASEVFVVNDRLECAGTFDDLYGCYRYGLILGDKKTGKANIQSHVIQLALYADSQVYNPETGERTPLESLAAGTRWGKYPVDKKRALWVHIPLGEGRTNFVELDLEQGMAAAELSIAVWKFQRLKADALCRYVNDEILAGARTQTAWELIQGATTRDELVGIASEYRDVWTEQMTNAGRRRIGLQ